MSSEEPGYEDDMRMLVNSGTDEDGEPNLRPWLSIKDDNPVERKDSLWTRGKNKD